MDLVSSINQVAKFWVFLSIPSPFMVTFTKCLCNKNGHLAKPLPPQQSSWLMDVPLVHAWRAIMWWASPWFVVYVEISLIHLQPIKLPLWLGKSRWAVIYADHLNIQRPRQANWHSFITLIMSSSQLAFQVCTYFK